MRIWKQGIEIAVKSIHLIKNFPPEEKFGLSRQISRAAVSIPSNVAEGSSRLTEAEKARYIEIAIGSAFELETQLIISRELLYGDNQLRELILQEISLEQRMLNAYYSKLKGINFTVAL